MIAKSLLCQVAVCRKQTRLVYCIALPPETRHESRIGVAAAVSGKLRSKAGMLRVSEVCAATVTYYIVA